MKRPIFLFLFLAGVFASFAVPARAQADSAHVALEQKATANKWTPADKPARKVEWSAEDPAAEIHPAEEWLDGVEALQKVPEYNDREARRVRRDTLRAGKLNRKAARHAQREARAAEKPRRIKE